MDTRLIEKPQDLPYRGINSTCWFLVTGPQVAGCWFQVTPSTFTCEVCKSKHGGWSFTILASGDRKSKIVPRKFD